jgi:ParB family transcriptional regulator, chromosome partitioning protein
LELRQTQDLPGELRVELHRLQLRFADTRVHEARAIEQLARSIESCGQLVACIAVRDLESVEAVTEESAPRAIPSWVLIDGYRRVQALRRVGCDLARVQLWNCDVAQGLLAVLSGSQGRAYAPIEQALLLRELQVLGLSQHEMARRSGRDVSWISRRLQLVAELPDSVLAAVREGTLSCWAATRVISPLARANSEHAEALLAAVREQALSTRELRLWLQHYQGATRQTRERMVRHPKLFLQAQLAQEQQTDGERLRAGPEGQCLQELQRLRWLLQRVREHLRGLSAQNRAPELIEMIRSVSAELQAWREELQRGGFHDHDRNPQCGAHAGRPRSAIARDQPPAEALA